MVFFTLTTMKFILLLSVLLLAMLTSAFNVERSTDLIGYLDNLKAAIKNMDKEFEAKLSNIAGGAVFTRWGRTVCPSRKDLVYKGYAAGAHYTNKAAGSNVLCLPEHPKYSLNTPGHNAAATIFGVEYESPLLEPNMKKVFDQDVPCAVCRSRSRSSHIMIAGTNKCKSGWKSEYDGYLMGPHFNYASGEYLCVDKQPEGITGGHKNENGLLLYLVESRCGSLPCPPYKDGLELTCVVCTK